MTAGELRRMLDDVGDDCEVRFASQPSWPFEYSISSEYFVGVPASGDDEGEDSEDGTFFVDSGVDGDGEVLYLAEGTQLGYLPRRVANHLGWGR